MPLDEDPKILKRIDVGTAPQDLQQNNQRIQQSNVFACYRMTLGQQDKYFLGATFLTACIGAGLMAGGFILRFGRGFGTFVTYARKDNDFLELERLDMIFGLFTAAAGILVISFFISVFATFKRNKFFLYTYCGIIVIMIVVQLVAGLLAFQYSDSIKQLADDDVLNESLGKAKVTYQTGGTSDELNFWTHTQNTFSCCGVLSSDDWKLPSTDLLKLNCFTNNYKTGCEKQIRNRISQDAQYLGVASMGVLLVEIIASFLAGYRAYNLNYEE